MIRQSELDASEVSRLRAQLSLAAGTTLSKLQELVIKNSNGDTGNTSLGVHGMRYEGLTREELSRAVDEKDGIIQK
jgi:hypothetical protein